MPSARLLIFITCMICFLYMSYGALDHATSTITESMRSTITNGNI